MYVTSPLEKINSHLDSCPATPKRAAQHWMAELKLGFEAHQHGTRMVHTHHYGPLRVQRPFYPEGPDTCHVYLLHPPGGMVAGDNLQMEFKLGKQSHALLTTPSAGKVYRAAEHQPPQYQHIHFKVGEHAVAEWLPQENIIFSGARVTLQTRIDLEETATFIGWDLMCLGRPAGKQPFNTGSAHQELSVYRDDKPLLLEKGKFIAGDDLLTKPWGLQNQPVTGTLICVWPGVENCQREALIDQLRENLSSCFESCLWSATLIRDVIAVRYLGDCTEQARQLFIAAWQTLRPQVVGKPACQPRIWNT